MANGFLLYIRWLQNSPRNCVISDGKIWCLNLCLAKEVVDFLELEQRCSCSTNRWIYAFSYCSLVDIGFKFMCGNGGIHPFLVCSPYCQGVYCNWREWRRYLRQLTH
ncbi:hypothetical protein Pint_13894 [Pistacia integerrima]|uniref:Uncharacterized protein n=1 Tax=Pistacia integerrima TaxID=434235 RepID=A0ACC0Y429_9ROSI|nr:hypothetical protein Pint_13894 [Pistacia integerrima]